jgi:curved DNA-binding protein CbpA
MAPMASARSYYDTLNVSPEAESVVIEAAYRALMKRYHPDQGAPPGQSGPSATEINEAYAVLREPGRRAEYDRNEWVRQKNIQLASYTPPPAPARRTNFFGWSGWLVALALAGMIGLLVSRGKVEPLSAAEKARAAAMVEPDMRSQPFKPGEQALSEGELAEIRADAYAGRKAVAIPPAAAPEPLAVSPPAQATGNAPRPSWGKSWRKAPKRRTPTQRTRQEKDFLEREGYIY